MFHFSEMLNFKGARDTDGFVGDFSEATKVDVEQYQIKVSTLPGSAIFEASITYDKENRSYKTKVCVPILS